MEYQRVLQAQSEDFDANTRSPSHCSLLLAKTSQLDCIKPISFHHPKKVNFCSKSKFRFEVIHSLEAVG